MRRPAEAAEPTPARPGRPRSRVAVGPIEQPGRTAGRATPRTGPPALAVSRSGGPRPRPGGVSPRRGRSRSGVYVAVGGRAGGLVARRSGPALARDPVGATGPGRDPRRLPRDSAGPAGERVVLLESDRIALPFTYTWARPVILLPAALCDGSEPEALRYVLAHEWSHVERRDAWAWNLACLAGLVLFYQPLFWWLRRQLRLCQDYLADDRAAAAGSAEDYAAFLVRLARVRRSAPAVARAGDRRPALEPLPEGRHARPGPRTAGAPLPGRLEPRRRRGRGRRDRRRLGPPPRCRRHRPPMTPRRRPRP